MDTINIETATFFDYHKTNFGLHFHSGILDSARDGLMNLLPELAVVILSRALSLQKSVLKPQVTNSIRVNTMKSFAFPAM